MNLATAFKNRFSKKNKKQSGFPKFKSKHTSGSSFSVSQYFTIKPGQIKLPKIGWVSCKMHRKLEGSLLVKQEDGIIGFRSVEPLKSS